MFIIPSTDAFAFTKCFYGQKKSWHAWLGICRRSNIRQIILYVFLSFSCVSCFSVVVGKSETNRTPFGACVRVVSFEDDRININLHILLYAAVSNRFIVCIGIRHVHECLSMMFSSECKVWILSLCCDRFDRRQTLRMKTKKNGRETRVCAAGLIDRNKQTPFVWQSIIFASHVNYEISIFNVTNANNRHSSDEWVERNHGKLKISVNFVIARRQFGMFATLKVQM